MLKNFRPIGLMLFAGALCSPGNIKADTTPISPSVSISQQNGKVTGTVEDEFGPVTGASVIVKGTTNGIITDLDGNFTLEGVKNGNIFRRLYHTGNQVHRSSLYQCKIRGRFTSFGRSSCNRFQRCTKNKDIDSCRC